MKPDARVFVAGHRGLVGSAFVRKLKESGYRNLLLRTRSELNLCNQAEVRSFFESERPDIVILAAARVGGIYANNTLRWDFIYDNLLIETNVIGAAHKLGVERFLFLGSSCIYPRDCEQPMKESALLTGPLETTNRPYAIAKIAGVELCSALNAQYGRSYLAIMPTNLYGPGDNFDPETSHVLPALIRRFCDALASNAKSVTIWGTGKSRREFLYVDDLADAGVFLLEQTDTTDLLNIGVGKDISIAELAELVANLVGYDGEILYDTSKPDGTPRKLLDVSAMTELGWSASYSLQEGLQRTVDWFRRA